MAENIFNENKAYLENALAAISDVEDLKDKLEEAKVIHKKSKKAVASEEKSIADEINTTIKKRKDQIASSYDKQIDENNARIKQIQSKKEKKRNQRMESRIEKETASLREENRQLKTSVRTLYKQNGVPAFCNSKLYYTLFMPHGFKEIFQLLLVIAIMCVGLPAGVIHLLQKKFTDGQPHTALCVVIVALIVIVEFVIYFAVLNGTKVKHRDYVMKGRKTRNKIKANDKAIKAIKNSIEKDKDESVYGLGKYDDKIGELEAVRDSISNDKLVALTEFENETKQIIIDEINGRRLPKLESLKRAYAEADKRLTALSAEISERELDITNKYETYLGKDFCTDERLSDLLAIMQEGEADTVSEAIKIYKGDDK